MKFTVERLPGGAGLAVAEMPHVESVSVGLWLGVGGRHEPVSLGGVSHFIEHLLFKGTPRRSARQISEAVEGVGGYLNAFTAEEMTCYFAKASVGHFPVLCDVLMDMLARALFPAEEMEKERGVIIEEIRMYEDQPPQVAQERLNALLWPGQALGRPLAGTIANIEKMKRPDLLAYRKKFYHGGNLWITVAGKITPEQAGKEVRRWLKNFPQGRKAAGRKPTRRRQAGPRFEVVAKPIEQTHVAMGFPAVSRHDPRRFALRLLSVMLGENMSSRLFQSIREQHGLAYSIQSSCATFADTGSFVISAGVENAKFEKALGLTWKELRKISQQKPSLVELQRAKEYTIGQLWLGLESTTNQMMWLGEGLIGYDRVPQPAEVVRKLEMVTREEVLAVAQQLLRKERLHLVVVSPEVGSPQLEKILRHA
jgi:predicted Zn-dependent peptidase